MKEKFVGFLIILLILSHFSVAQKKMSKEEILSYWSNTIKKQRDSIRSSLPLSIRHRIMPEKVNHFIDSLYAINIDTVGIYLESYVGSHSTNPCDCELIPWIAYIYWTSNNNYFFKELYACCEKEPLTIDNDIFFSFFIDHKSTLLKEEIMPVIESGETDEDGYVDLNIWYLDHQTGFDIFCRAGNDSINISYSQDCIEDESNIFLIENIESKSNEWRLHIKDQLKKLEED